MINFTANSVEAILFDMRYFFLAVLTIILIRILVSRFLNTLMNRGVITVGTKALIIRFIDVTLVFFILIALLQLLMPQSTVIIATASFLISMLILFYYEVREFIAYINLQLLRHIRGKSYEIMLPNHNKPIYGRILSVDPMTTVIEDIYGKKIYVANSLIVNSIMKEYVPSIQLRLRLSHAEGDPIKVVQDVIESLKGIELGIFRIDEKKFIIDRIGGGEVVARINAYPLSIPVRLADLVRLADSLTKSLAKYNPVIEFIEHKP